MRPKTFRNKIVKINNKFNIGDTVYLITDPEQSANLVTAIRVCRNHLEYELSYVSSRFYAEDFELSSERNVLTACGVGKVSSQ